MAEVTTELTEKNQISTSPDSPETSKEKENEYIKLVNKKIRTLNKKLNINIANIEKKITSGGKINEDEQKVLGNKQTIIKSLKEFEDLKNQMLKVQNQEEKDQKKAKRKVDAETKGDEITQINGLIELLHVVDFFDKTQVIGIESKKQFLSDQDKLRREGKSTLVNSEEDIDTFNELASLISRKTSTSLLSAVNHAVKLVSLNEEELFAGKTYKQIRHQLAEVVASQLFVNGPKESLVQEPNKQEVQETPSSNHVSSPIVPNHNVEEKLVEEEVEQIKEADEGEQVAEQTNTDEIREKKDQNKRGFRRGSNGRSGRGRGRGNFSNQVEGSPKEGPKENRRGGGRGGGNKRGGGGNRGGGANRGNPQKSNQQQSAVPS